MRITGMSISSFRNIKYAQLKFSNGINIFVGENAQGKTNVLESVYVCATGRSHRTRLDSQLVNFDAREAHIKLFSENEGRLNRIDVHIKKDEKRGIKGVAINGVPVHKSGELFGTLFVVIFSPEDLQLIKNSPSERRRFVDMELCQLKNVYYYNLGQYYKVLKQRNNLLKKIQKNSSLRDTIFVWDEQLCLYGKYVIKSRDEFIKRVSFLANKIHKSITGGKEELEICYKPNVSYDDIEIKTKQNIDKDILFGSTSSGPHKDDMSFVVNENDVKIFGSQGQQRTAALSAKLAEIEIIKEETGHDPVLLLDDVLSELDEKRQNFLLDTIGKIQTILTCTGVEDIISKYTKNVSIFDVSDGKIFER
ncbi:MAG: DNA replication/repair protein RecF [Firmicutes bacterium]|nr:DNA replication/repair protein RecF [Bacillota bacterium]